MATSREFHSIDLPSHQIGNSDIQKRGKDFDGSRTRLLTVPRHSLLGTGLRIIGGNAVGIFIAEINPQTPAATMGIKFGDEIESVSNEMAILIINV